ncbi:MAG: hypothetical protein HWE22_09995 [Flavobacteriales bacterium]|nr:hypothetical protein [Flavobacteriales bacterium]
MRVEGQHIIEKVKVDVNLTSTELAEKIKSEISDFIQLEIMPILESFLDEAMAGEKEFEALLQDKTVQLDKLELNIDADHWNTNSVLLKEEVRAEVEEKLRPVIQIARSKAQVSSAAGKTLEESFQSDDVTVLSQDQRLINTFFHFLNTGTLPWWVQPTEESKELFSDDRLLKGFLEKPDLIRSYFERNASNYTSQNRLLKQFSPLVVLKCVEIRLKEVVQTGETNIAELKQLVNEIPKEMATQVINVTWQLAKSKSEVNQLFYKNGVITIFRYAREHLFQNEAEKSQLDKSFALVYHTLRLLNSLSTKKWQTSRVKQLVVQSLNDELRSDEKNNIKQSKMFQNTFSGNVEFDLRQNLLEEDQLKTYEKSEKLRMKEQPKNNDSPHFSEVNKSEGQSNSVEDTDRAIQKEDISPKDDTKTTVESELGNTTSEESQAIENREQLISELPKDDVEKTHDSKLSDATSEENQAVKKREELSSDVSKGDDESEINETQNDQKQTQDLVSESSSEVDSSKTQDVLSKEEMSGNDEQQKNQDAIQKAIEESDEEIEQDALSVDETKANASPEQKSIETLQELLSSTSGEEVDTASANRENAVLPKELFVQNAGLVLLNPFLPSLFKQLELINEEKQLIKPELAAHILHYAATGREGDFEFEMAFEKYLCGISPSFTLKKDIVLTEIQKKEVKNMLSAVLEYWTALKSKSTELLQHEFLSRSGKLLTESSNHRVIVEKKSYDLLLDKLPWSYSMIKFSWLDNLIFVEW